MTLLSLKLQLHFANDPAARVRVCALDTLTSCLCLVKDLPRNDANIFPEYVLPSIAPLATDSSVVVRIAYARNVGVYPVFVFPSPPDLYLIPEFVSFV